MSLTYSLSHLINAIEKRNPPLYDMSTQRWTGFPDITKWTDISEREMATFLNSIVNECVTLLGGIRAVGAVSGPRRWTAKYSTIPLSGHDAKRKLDLILLDDVGVADWRCVRSIGEMKSGNSKDAHAAMFQQLAGESWRNYTGGCPAESYLAGKTSIIFASQDNREFVLSVGFQGEMMFLYRIDRGGAISSLSIQIQGHESQWKLFLRTIVSLAIGDPEVIGYDTSIGMVPVKKGDPCRVMSLQYYPLHMDSSSWKRDPTLEIISTIFIGDGLVGRGTCVFRTRDSISKEPFIIKDTWHDPRRSFTEGQILQLIDGIPYIPRYVQEVVVSTYRRSRTSLPRKMAVDQQQGGIDRLVEELANGKFEDRIHLRLQMKGSKTKLITEFNNRKELAMALLCCVKGEVIIKLQTLIADFSYVAQRIGRHLKSGGCCTVIYISVTSSLMRARMYPWIRMQRGRGKKRMRGPRECSATGALHSALASQPPTILNPPWNFQGSRLLVSMITQSIVTARMKSG
jgi:hypothetical protein